MIKDSTKDFLDDYGPVSRNEENDWFKYTSGGFHGIKPRKALEGRLVEKPKTLIKSKRQVRGIRHV